MKRNPRQMTAHLLPVTRFLPRPDLLRMRLRALLRMLAAPSARTRLNDLRRDLGLLLRIHPLFTASDRESFLEPPNRACLSELSRRCAEILAIHGQASFHLRRFCLCCNETTRMLVDYEHSFVDENGILSPNWRERLVCRNCGMNSRQRLVAKLVQQAAAHISRPAIYLMEQVTPIFEWVRRLGGSEVHGSEYLGYEFRGGDRIQGVRHEDAMNLSYADGSFDLIVSNDVMEHIPDPEKALRECFRVLKPGGIVLATFPFHVANARTVTRARLVGTEVEHLLPPQYHGNPVSPDGSLVFSDFGWDLLDVARRAGFSPAVCEVYSSEEFGHLGAGLLVFWLSKTLSTPSA